MSLPPSVPVWRHYGCCNGGFNLSPRDCLFLSRICGDTVTFLRQLHIKVGHTTLRMCGSSDGNLVIDILPFRMVIGALSRQSNPADKSKCRIKSGKLRALAQPQLITIGADDPAVQLFDRNNNFRFA